MIRKRKLLRVIAVFFILELIMDITLPYVAHALTSGPTAPEATSFEPVDTTDMVNLVTGDFTYNLPLLEVPGPSGGYPLSLAYHAGIQPLEEASWVGLGWSLNPGSITRIVNGYVDDHNGVFNAQRTFWEGGSTKTTSIGVSVGIANTATVSAGLSFSQDTYRGFGVGGYVGAGVGVGFGKDSPLGIGGSATVSFMDYDGDSDKGQVSAGMSVGILAAQRIAENIGSSGSLGVNYNTQSGFGSGASVNVGSNTTSGHNISLLGASIGTNGGSSSGNVGVGGGTASVNNSKSNNVSSSSRGFSADIPTPIPAINLRLSRQYTRYWIDQLESVRIYGSLYAPDYDFGRTQVNVFKNRAFDTYDLADLRLPSSKFKTSAKVLGGTFPDYDIYSVNAQGISGNIRPYHIQKALYRQNLEVEQGKSEYFNYSLPGRDWPVHYRFVGDFSNHHSSNSSLLTYNDQEDELVYNFETIDYPAKIKGSRHITYFTNSTIKGEDALDSIKRLKDGFIDGVSTGFRRKANDQVGAFQVTNESGVTYHFSLPVYSKNEWTYSQNTDDKQRKSFNSLKRAMEYAYTWYLTGITGPDFVDRGEIGKLDDEDWGYWVSLEYGLWTDRYGWRNPGEGFHKDLDTRYINYSKGDKELYYLNYIRTKTHTAVFAKEIRKDAKGVVHNFDDKAVLVNDNTKSVIRADEGGFSAVTKEIDCRGTPLTTSIHPRSTLKLQKIYLVANKDFSLDSKSNLLSADATYQHGIGTSASCFYHYGNNIVDIHDIETSGFAGADSKILRSVEFKTGYSLSQGMPNSFVSEVDVDNTSGTPSTAKAGRLTLNSITFNGKNEANHIPPIHFYYGKNPNYKGNNSDIWGFYKSDFNAALCEINENEGRAVSTQSAQDVDAWSLSTIRTSLGAFINIDYESDDYRLPDEYKSFDFNIRGVEALTDNKVKITFDTDLVASSYFEVNEEIESLFLYRHDLTSYSLLCGGESCNPPGTVGGPCDVNNGDVTQNVTDIVEKYNSVIEEIGTGYITVVDPGLFQAMNSYDIQGVSGECLHYRNVYNPEFRAGVISRVGQNSDVLGGGLRVKKINVANLYGERNTIYDYTIDGHSSGVTSYEPTKIEKIILNSEEIFIDGVSSIDDNGDPVEVNLDGKAIEFIKQAYSNRLSRILAISRDIPGPGVYYSRVEAREEVKKLPSQAFVALPSKSVYDFEVFNPNMIGTVEAVKDPGNNPQNVSPPGQFDVDKSYSKVITQKVALNDYTSRIGNLKSISLYDAGGRILSKTTNHYLHDEIIVANPGDKKPPSFEENNEQYENLVNNKYNGIGIQSEVFINARFVRQGQDGLLVDALGEDEYYLAGIVSERKHYPNIQTRQTSKNYKTGIVTESHTLAFDFLSGQATHTLSNDGYGNYYLSQSTPAYHKYHFMGSAQEGGANMLTQVASTETYKVNDATGLALESLVSASVQTWSGEIRELPNSSSLNVTLTFTADETPGNPYTLWTADQVNGSKLDPGDKIIFNEGETPIIGMIYSTKQKLEKLEYKVFFYREPSQSPFTTEVLRPGVYRKHKSYQFIGDDRIDQEGLYPMNLFNTTFDAWHHGEGPTDTRWQKNSEITLYDVYSHALQAEDVNGNLAATRFDRKHENVISTVANAGYQEFIYSGAEDGILNTFIGTTNETGKVSGDKAHTGLNSVKTTGASSNGFKYTLTNKKDRTLAVSVWSDAPNATLHYKMGDNTAVTLGIPSVKQSGDWYLLRATVPTSAGDSDIQVWCAANGQITYFDDFRVHPVDATMISYVYNEWGELSHILDANNIYTRYEYDGMGRLKFTHRETFDHGEVQVSEHVIHYWGKSE